MVDLDRVKPDRKVYLCKWYFYVGLCFLPFLWAVNVVWFFNEAFRKPPYEQQKEIRKFVLLSTVGALCWIIVIVSWVTYFQTHRSSWGVTADYLSFVIPTGDL